MTGYRAKTASLSLLIYVMISLNATAAEPEQNACPAQQDLANKDAFLRMLSLDLRGNIPSLDDYADIETQDDVPESTIDSWLAQEAFAHQVVRRYSELLSVNITNVRLLNNVGNLGRKNVANDQGQKHYIYYRSAVSKIYRGANNTVCMNKPAVFKNGIIQTEPGPNGTVLEGWVEILPYWLPAGSAKIKVCAYDAQAAEFSPSGTPCDTMDAANDVGCGCGLDLRYCKSGNNETGSLQAVHKSFALAFQKRIFSVIHNDDPFGDLFSSTTLWVNGPIVHFFKHMVNINANAIMLTPMSFNKALLPDLDWHDMDTWIPIELPPDHAGILTDPLYLLRFQTNRARANRVYNSFLCQPFQPPTGGIEVTGEAAKMEPDLQVRAGCSYCHAGLEPAASFWGRWREGGAGFLHPKTFPKERPDCMACAKTGALCSTECKDHYLITLSDPAEEPYLGQLKAYLFRDPEHYAHIEMGPQLLMAKSLMNQTLTRCVTRQTAEFYLGRKLHPREATWYEALVSLFEDSNFSFKTLVKAIVLSPEYRRVR